MVPPPFSFRAQVKKNIPLLIFNLFLAAVYLPITYIQVVFYDTSDYPAHINMARFFYESGSLVFNNLSLPHPLNHSMVIFYKHLLGFSFPISQVITTLMCYPLLANIVYAYFTKNDPFLKGLKGMLLAFSVTIAAPIFLLVGLDQKYYFGYSGFALYHNPTIILLRPLALLLWIVILNNLKKGGNPAGTIVSFLLVIITTLAKPNFTIAIIPAIGLLIIWQLIRHEKIQWRYILFGLFLPAGLVLLWQYQLAFQGARDSKIIFAPFEVTRWMSDYPSLKFLLSILFPLGVAISQFKHVIWDKQLALAWITFGIGAGYGYLLAEQGKSLFSANFLWCTQITLFILFIESIRFFITRSKLDNLNRTFYYSLWIILVAQVICGIIYYIHCFINPVYI